MTERPFRTYAKHGDLHYDVKTAEGCFQAGEPTFLLRAQDTHAAETVRYWASLVSDPEMRRQAEAIAEAMEAWPHRKEPD